MSDDTKYRNWTYYCAVTNRPGGGPFGFSKEELDGKLRAYLAQVDPDAKSERNKNF